MKNFKQIAFGLLVGAMALSFSAFTTAKARLITTWHISSTNGSGNYVVQTSGSCRTGSNPCQFSTSLPADQPDGSYSPAYLSSNGVTVSNGSFQP